MDTSHTSSKSDETPLLLSFEQAANALSVSTLFLRRLSYKGEIKSIKLGRRRLIPAQELNKLVNRNME